MNRILLFLTQWLRVWVIEIGGKPYLERYRVGKAFGHCIYLHRFVSCDGERALHDHPWRYAICLVLAGGYEEERLRCLSPNVGLVAPLHKVRWLNILTERTFHRIAGLKPNTWTLMITGPRTMVGLVPDGGGLRVEKSWGFIDGGVVANYDGAWPQYQFEYQQPFAGQRTEDFMDQMPTGRELRLQQKATVYREGTTPTYQGDPVLHHSIIDGYGDDGDAGRLS